MSLFSTKVLWHNYSPDSLTVKFLVAAIWFCPISSYGVPASLNYSVCCFTLMSVAGLYQCLWLLQFNGNWLSVVPLNMLVETFLTRSGLSSLYKVVSDRPNWFSVEIVVLMYLRLSNRVRQPEDQYLFAAYGSPVEKAIADVLIMVSLCVFFYDGSSGSAFPRLLVIAKLVMSVDHQDNWTLGLEFIVGKSSLNSWGHLRSQAAGTLSDLRISAVHFANPPRLRRDIESSKDREKWCDIPEMAVIDITTDPALDKTTVL
ncbi:hypothetical protein F5J12DRAFT_785443 [Pisolithus orientalis]|uniref:uncharacterized protein n=1 Tax=Pisolithus orientalis TaxID=936130 RepID=UPI002224175A|nr:uncharacterized protein F5J12DRAFT_785443 [Pisolithus orientalis]KAI5996483.1 hypothetical protein F5J12DRAFT_785443 [Pisolithus orientalis]